MDLLKHLEANKIVVIAITAVVLVVGIMLMSFNIFSPLMSTLYSGLSINDSSMVVAKLQSLGIKYESDTTGTEIKVPADKVLTLRMNFAQEGIPDSGNIVGYEIFDKNEALGTSQFVYNVNLIRALEGELSRTISTLSSIEYARVHLVMPKKELFAKINSEPSASVVLKLRSHNRINKPEILSITHLIATAVNGLRVENITIIDTKGRPLKLGTGEKDQAALTSDSNEFQIDVEKRLQHEIEELLARYVGIGKVKANVSAEIIFDREVINEEIYDPDGQVIRSRRTEEEKAQETKSNQNVGVAGNLPNVNEQANGESGNNSSKSKVNELINYEITKTVSNKIIESGKVRKLSIAILVDGTYDLDEETGEANYIPRTEEELLKIRTLVVSGVGIDTNRGDIVEVINLQFSPDFNVPPEKEDPLDWIKGDLQNIVQTVVLGIVIIVILLLVVRPIVLRAIEAASGKDEKEDLQTIMENVDKEVKELQERAEQEAGLVIESAGMVGGKEQELLNLTSTEDKKKIDIISILNNLVEKHPEETISIVRNWLYQD